MRDRAVWNRMSAGEYALAFLVGGIVYPIIEIFWRGYTHISMALLGGICMSFIYFIYHAFSYRSIVFRALLSTLMISAWELLFGAILNIACGMDVWDYSDMPLNFMGQVCLPYASLWLLLSFPAFIVCHYLRAILNTKGKGASG
ncbi:MAG: hypothetical protein IIW20_03775 [Clostridia bacterium]|nr:hypothetical protein [Clostridia bacterium]